MLLRLLALAALLLLAIGLFFVFRQQGGYKVDAPDTQYVFGGESVPSLSGEWRPYDVVVVTKPNDIVTTNVAQKPEYTLVTPAKPDDKVAIPTLPKPEDTNPLKPDDRTSATGPSKPDDRVVILTPPKTDDTNPPKPDDRTLATMPAKPDDRVAVATPPRTDDTVRTKPDDGTRTKPDDTVHTKPDDRTLATFPSTPDRTAISRLDGPQRPFVPGSDLKPDTIAPVKPRETLAGVVLKGVRVSYDPHARSWWKLAPPKTLQMSFGISLHLPPEKADQMLSRPIQANKIVLYGLEPITIDQKPQAIRATGETWVDLAVNPGALPNPPTDQPVNFSLGGFGDLYFTRKATEGLFEIRPQECLVWVGIRPTGEIKGSWTQNYQFRFLADPNSPNPVVPNVDGWFTDKSSPTFRLVMRVQDQVVHGYVEVLDISTNQVVGQSIPLTLEAIR